MSRRALIIASPGVKGAETYCGGVNIDVVNYKSVLKSPIGGLWDDREIVVLIEPSRAMTMIEIGRQRNVDYSLTIFTGHGYHAEDDKATIIELQSNVDLSSDELRLGAPKHTLILDCCRVVHKTMFAEDAAEKMLKGSVNQINADDCRKFYDKAIADSPKGQVVLFACSVDETAGDIASQGGIYSYSLIHSAERWSPETIVDTAKNYRPMSVVDAHEKAVERVHKLNHGQTPTIQKPRSEPYFPFSIIA